MNRSYLLDFQILIGKPTQMHGLGASYKILEEAGASSAVVPINVGSSRASWTYREGGLAGRWVFPKIGTLEARTVRLPSRCLWTPSLLSVDGSEQAMMVAGRPLGTRA